MHYEIWATLVGILLTGMALTQSFIDRIPVSSAMVYLAVGLAVSPLWLDLAHFDLPSTAHLVERGTEAVVLVSLFTSGLKMSVGLGDRRWQLPLRLATVSMVVTVGGITLIGWQLLGMPLGAAVLLGGILAPTDPVLASDVQVVDAGDRDRLRFALTGEGGLNDGTSFPAVMLGLGLLGLHDLGDHGMRWLALDVLWSMSMGAAIGAVLGMSIGRFVLYLRLTFQQAVGLDDFISLGLVATSYGVATLCHASGFLAVFAAGFALRRTERRATEWLSARPQLALKAVESGSDDDSDSEVGKVDPITTKVRAAAVDAKTAPAYMAHSVLTFNEQLERIGEATIVVAVGATLWAVDWHRATWWLVPALFLVLRPISVAIGLFGSDSLHGQRRLVAWFGIRGIGSVFYLAYAQTHGLIGEVSAELTAITLSVVVASIVLHGLSVTPLIWHYQCRMRRTRKDTTPSTSTTREKP